jgi:CBS domain-containing protein
VKKVPRDVGTSSESGLVKVADLMSAQVMTVTRGQSVGHVRELMARHGVHSLPVVNTENEPIGIVTSTDLVETVADETLLGQIMTREVLTVPLYEGVHIAARIMRNHHVHHLVVTHEKGVVGVLSSFDLLRLVENKRFVPKNMPTRSTKGGGERRRREDGAAGERET